MSALELDMVVLERSTKKLAGKPTKYRLVLEDGNKNRLTLISDNRGVYDGFLENVWFQVKVAKIQSVLATGETKVEE